MTNQGHQNNFITLDQKSFFVDRDIVRIVKGRSFDDGLEQNFIEVFVEGQSMLTMTKNDLATFIDELKKIKKEL